MTQQAAEHVAAAERTVRAGHVRDHASTVIDLVAAEKRLSDRRRRREQLILELETARAARRRRRPGLRQA